MRALTKLRTRRSYVIEMVCFAVIWVFNLVEIANHFRSMDLMEGLTAGMIFCIAPLSVWQAFSRMPESRYE